MRVDALKGEALAVVVQSYGFVVDKDILVCHICVSTLVVETITTNLETVSLMKVPAPPLR